jgi:hypothetical protein
MAGAQPELLFFDRGDATQVADHMVRLAADRSGWVVLDPEIDADDLADAPQTGGVFSGRGPAVPELSWVPGRPGRRGRPPVSIGLRHATGPKVVERLARYEHAVPGDWLVKDDSPKRGLVAELPDDVDQAAVLQWLLRAAEAVTAVPLTGQWRGSVHRYV